MAKDGFNLKMAKK